MRGLLFTFALVAAVAASSTVNAAPAKGKAAKATTVKKAAGKKKKSAEPAASQPQTTAPSPSASTSGPQWATTAASINASLNEANQNSNATAYPYASQPAVTIPAEPPPPPSTAPPPPAPAPTPPPLATSNRDKAEQLSSSPKYRVTIGVNPLPMIAGRFGGNLEVMLARHHAIVGGAYYQMFSPAMLKVIMPSEVNVDKGAKSQFGGEVGYRFYSGHEGANGFFAGVSGVVMPLAYPKVNELYESSVESFHAYGGAIDVGLQAIVGPGFTVGGGIGVMYLAWNPPASVKPPPGVAAPDYPEPHVLPRLLLTAGWSF